MGINKYFGALITGVALMATPSCTDTWNEHYNTEDAHTAKESVWELLSGREELSRFCSIAEKARFYRDEFHPAYTYNGSERVDYTFKDILSGNTPVTVWAPHNKALTEEQWKKYEAMLETDGYNLQMQLLGNHIALYRRSMAIVYKDPFRLINNKIVKIDNAEGKKMFQDSEVIEWDIAARNGLLHILEEGNEFRYNIYEYIKFSGDFTYFRNYMVERDTIEFKPDYSIEGWPDEYANPTYVDSAFILNNMMFQRKTYDPIGKYAETSDAWMNTLKMLNADINNEDSLCVVVIPTDRAWEDAVKQMKDYYNYGDGMYPRMEKVKYALTKDAKRDIYGARHAYRNAYDPDNTRTYETVDSLRAVNIEMDIIDPLAFNIREQPQKDGKTWTKETFITQEGYKSCEYLLTTRGDTIRDVLGEDGSTLWSKNELFDKNRVKEVKEMSNGFAIISDTWNYPRSFWMRDIEVDVNKNNIYDFVENRTSMMTIVDRSTNKLSAMDWIDQYGRCYSNHYMRISKIGRYWPDLGFILRGNRQGDADIMNNVKYDVYVVFVPEWYQQYEATPTRDFPPKDSEVKKSKLECTIYGWSGKKKYPENESLGYDNWIPIASNIIHYMGQKVDTMLVLSDVVFPLSYKNLYDAHPILNIKFVQTESGEKGYQNAFNIDQIILRCKETE